jgi:hypothetical protein
MRDIIFYFIAHPDITTERDMTILKNNLSSTVKELGREFNIHLVGNFNPKIEGVIFNRAECTGCNHSDIKLFYKHFSKRTEKVELNRILRWDSLHRFCQKKNIKSFIHYSIYRHPKKEELKEIDISKDVRCNIRNIDNRIVEVDTSLMIFKNTQIIFNFTQFLLEQYINRSSNLYSLTGYINSKQDYLGISDKLLWGLFRDKNITKFQEL